MGGLFVVIIVVVISSGVVMMTWMMARGTISIWVRVVNHQAGPTLWISFDYFENQLECLFNIIRRA